LFVSNNDQSFNTPQMITDLSYLITMSEGDKNFINEMISIFKEQVEEYRTIMPELLAKGDLINLSKVAHKAKSSVAVMGMNETAELLKELQDISVPDADTVVISGYVDKFISDCNQALEELEKQ